MVDWEGIERSEEFRELVQKRRSFVVPATIFFLAYYMGFILLAGYAPDFMGKSVYEGLTVGYCLALVCFRLGVFIWAGASFGIGQVLAILVILLVIYAVLRPAPKTSTNK